MRRATTAELLSLGICLTLWACGGDEAAEDAALPDAAPPIEATCDEATQRAVGPVGPFTCDGEPEFITVDGVDVFKYEASHPLAGATSAFPCAASNGPAFQPPEGETEPCSKAGVRPWHSVSYDEAKAACEGIGWRLCTRDELLRACGGAPPTRFTYGDTFDAAACNVRNGYADPSSDEGLTSEAPTGAYAACVSAEGLFDLGGNLWEWAQAEGGQLYRVGAGWKLIAELHHDDDQACSALVQAPEVLAHYAASDVGFRCCR